MAGKRDHGDRQPGDGPIGPGDTRAAGASSIARDALQALAPWLEHRRFRAGRVLFREGSTQGLLVGIERGHVRAYRTLPDGRAATLYLFGPGDVFGFLPLLDGTAYPATAEAVDEVTARVMSHGMLLEALRSETGVAATLLALLARRLREAFDRIELLSMRGALPRVAAAIAGLVPGAADPGDALVLALPVSAASFAADLGLTPETFSRAITQLVALGVLHRPGNRRLQILDLEALRRLAGLAAV
jgi:CRP/FNR family transcriptional regulator